MVIGGDFNLVLDVEKDKKNGIARTHQNALEVVQDAMENMELCDVWRIFNPALLADNYFIETIKIAIQETANEYKDDNLVNPLLLWDMIKLKVREKSITYSASIKKAKVKKEEELEKEIAMFLKTSPCFYSYFEEINISYFNLKSA